jgi:L-ascorbate 6-phosphate lactonase
MIEPFLTGRALVEDILSTGVPPGSLGIWRLGQAGMLLSFPEAKLLIDPYLSNHCEAVLGNPFDHRRLTRAPLDPAEIDFVDVIICTHEHLDHLDPPTLRTLARTNPAARVVAPGPSRRTLEDLGWERRVLSSTPETGLALSGLTIRGFAVPHEDFDEDPELGAPYQGYVVTDGYVTMGHLGDALDAPRVREALSKHDINVLAVPINGRDAARRAIGFAGNMTADEAVDLGRALNTGVTIPMHYDMFAQNVDNHALARFISRSAEVDLTVAALEVGEKFIYTTSNRRIS